MIFNWVFEPAHTSTLSEILLGYRLDSEMDMSFVGFVIFENRIKPDTPAVIEELYQANIRNVMLTGDNMHTAISVARTCGIIRPSDRVSIVNADDTGVRFKPVLDAGAHKNVDKAEVRVEFDVLIDLPEMRFLNKGRLHRFSAFPARSMRLFTKMLTQAFKVTISVF